MSPAVGEGSPSENVGRDVALAAVMLVLVLASASVVPAVVHFVSTVGRPLLFPGQ